MITSSASAACKRYRAKHPERTRLQLMLNNARIRAKRHGVPFSLTMADLVIPETCPVLGIKLCMPDGTGNPGDASPSLDRKVPSRGYVPSNIQIISYRANRIRNDATLEELVLVLAYAKGVDNGSIG